jgi:hypothetical protein
VERVRIPALIVAAGLLLLASSYLGTAWSRGQADGRDPSPPPPLDVRPVEGWLERSWDARSLEPAVRGTALCEPLGPLRASCTLEVHYEDTAPFRGVRTVTIDVTCERPRARAADCDWFEL